MKRYRSMSAYKHLEIISRLFRNHYYAFLESFDMFCVAFPNFRQMHDPRFSSYFKDIAMFFFSLPKSYQKLWQSGGNMFAHLPIHFQSSSTTTQISRIFTGAVVSFSTHMLQRLLFSLRWGVNTIKRLTLYQYLAFRMSSDIP